MAERRPFPPSPRRLALARASGLSAASPVVVGAIAALVALAVMFALGRAVATRVGADVVAAVNAADGHDAVSATRGTHEGDARDVRDAASPDTHAGARTGDVRDPASPDTDGDTHVGARTGDVRDAASPDTDVGAGGAAVMRAVAGVPTRVLELLLPLLVAGALAALVAHVAQTRSLWFPRRRLPGAPAIPRRARAGFDLVAAATIGAVAFGWLWLCAPRLALLVQVPMAAALAIASFAVTLGVAWVALGAVDALLRQRMLGEALAMTRDEKREDERMTAADPRWAAQRLSIARGPAVGDAVARSAIVVVGDDVAVAIEWDAVRQPVPLRVVTGRGPRATQISALARRYRVAIHRDVELAAALVPAEGPVPERHWARLAELVAATGGRMR